MAPSMHPSDATLSGKQKFKPAVDCLGVEVLPNLASPMFGKHPLGGPQASDLRPGFK